MKKNSIKKHSIKYRSVYGYKYNWKLGVSATEVDISGLKRYALHLKSTDTNKV